MLIKQTAVVLAASAAALAGTGAASNASAAGAHASPRKTARAAAQPFRGPAPVRLTQGPRARAAAGTSRG